MEDTTSADLNKQVQKNIQEVIAYLNKVANYRYHHLIYKLIKNGHVKMGDLAEDSGYSKRNLYKIVDIFETKANESKTTQ